MLRTVFLTSCRFLTKVANFEQKDRGAECFHAKFQQQDKCAKGFGQVLAIGFKTQHKLVTFVEKLKLVQNPLRNCPFARN